MIIRLLLLSLIICVISVSACTPHATSTPEETSAPTTPIPEQALKSRFGYMAHHTDWQELQDDREEYSYLSWERAHPGFANWQEIEPREGEHHWEKIDQYVITAQENDIQILFTVWPFTDWDQERCNLRYKWQPNDWGKDPRHFISLAHRKGRPCDMGAYREFLRLLVERYDGDSKEDMPDLLYPIKYWEIGNEPDGAYSPDVGGLFFQGSARDYFDILKTSYVTIKDTDPYAIVLITALPSIIHHLGYGEVPEWVCPDFNLIELFELGVSKYFDIINLHEFGNTEEVVRFMQRYGAVDKPIWITEPGGITEFMKRAEDKNIPLATILEAEFEKEFQCGVERIFVGGPESLKQALHEAILTIEKPK